MMTSSFLATDPMVEEFCRQLAANGARRWSRGSSHGQQQQQTSQQTRPGSMRISKPTSANNSPGGSMGGGAAAARRRTMLLDGAARRRQHVLDQALFPSPAPATRPVSWHPSSTNVQAAHQLPYCIPPQLQHQQHQQHQHQQYPMPTPPYNGSELDLFADVAKFPPTPMAYSVQTSPVSAFSPLSLPYSAFDAAAPAPAPYLSVDTFAATLSPNRDPVPTLPSTASSSSSSSGGGSGGGSGSGSGSDSQGFSSANAFTPLTSTESFPSAPASAGPAFSQLDWDAFMSHGFDRPTAPPTPTDALLPFLTPASIQPQQQLPQHHHHQQQQQQQQQQPQVLHREPYVAPAEAEPGETEEAAAAAEDEEEGEILVGMGLYDPPEKIGGGGAMTYVGFSSLLVGGSAASPEGRTGMGLKLEESWEPPPPAEEDEEEEEEDDDDDEEGGANAERGDEDAEGEGEDE